MYAVPLLIHEKHKINFKMFIKNCYVRMENFYLAREKATAPRKVVL